MVSAKFEKNEIISGKILNIEINVLCGYESEFYSEDEFLCKKEEMLLYLQVTYQLELGSITAIFDYYAKFLGEKSNWPLEPEFISFIPDTLKYLSHCLLIENSECILSNVNQNAVELWKLVRNDITSITKHPDNFHLIDAHGLFYLIIEYAITAFRRPSDDQIDKLAAELFYGPKKLIPIMSRVSFSEMYDNMSIKSKTHLNNLLVVLCNYDFIEGHDKDYDVDRADYLACKSFEMPDYIFMDVEAEQINPNLNFFEWLLSIVRKEERIGKFDKIDVQETSGILLPNDKTNKCEADDALSPPPGYRIDASHIKDDMSVEIYSMGGLTQIRKSHALLEIRPYTSTPINMMQLDAFIVKHALGLFKHIESFETRSKQVSRILAAKLYI